MTLENPHRPVMNRKVSGSAREPVINVGVMKARRAAMGYSQVQLAVAAGCSSRTIQQIERGKQMDPSTSVTLRIAKALSMTVEALTKGHHAYTSRYGPHDPEVGR